MPLLILLVVVSLLCGPIALIVSVVALSRIRVLQKQHREKAAVPVPQQADPSVPPVVEAPPQPEIMEPGRPSAAPAKVAAEAGTSPPERAATYTSNDRLISLAAGSRRVRSIGTTSGLEQRIGTRWVLIAGVITVIFAVAFFLKYAYDKEWIGPLGRVAIAAAAGLVAVISGEWTRRRGYDIVAKGVTTLGFMILYATVFAAHRWHDLISSATAYALAIGTTAAAMLYAVLVNEVVVAVLSLIGGYVTPVVLSRGQNLPNLLFGYVLVLSAGATLCAHQRKWSIVNVLAFLGTYTLYTGWFERFYRPAMQAPTQLGVAIFWLAVFFAVYLILPVLYTLLKRVRSEVQDMVLVLANAGVAFYYLWTMLTPRYEKWLAFSSLVMGVAYLALMGLVFLRCRADRNLCNALLIAGLALVTVAVQLHFEMYTIAAIWAVEAVALTATGLRYRNKLVQLAAGAVLGLAGVQLVAQWPMHEGEFRIFLNPSFGAWALVAAATITCHILYRLDTHLDADVRGAAVQVLYTAGLLLLMLAVTLEIWHHSDLISHVPMGPFGEKMTVVFAAFLLLFATRPICPPGQPCQAIAVSIACLSSFFLVVVYGKLHEGPFPVFANADFARSLLLIAALFAAAWLLHQAAREPAYGAKLSRVVALAGILATWMLITEEIWFHYSLARRAAEWRFLAQMFISIAWASYATALLIIGFWHRIRQLRYVALGIFLLLLAKIFIVDTRTVETIYRIAGFLVTGLALVGVSYLYQYLKKKDFFEVVLTDRRTESGRRR